MISSPSLLSILWWLSIAANAALGIRLYRLGLYRTYRFFFAYLIFQSMRSLALLAFPVNGSTYAILYEYTVPVLWVFYVLVVLELYSLVLQQYSGINSLGRWTLYGALAVSTILSLLSLIPTWGNEQYRVLFWATTVERGVVSSLVLFLFLILLFLSRYPLQLSRNIIVHCVVYTIFFLGTSMTILVRNVAGAEFMRNLNHVLIANSLVCYGVWMCFLTREGEQRIVTLHRGSDPADERRLVEQLQSINSTLLRAARK